MGQINPAPIVVIPIVVVPIRIDSGNVANFVIFVRLPMVGRVVFSFIFFAFVFGVCR